MPRLMLGIQEVDFVGFGADVLARLTNTIAAESSKIVILFSTKYPLNRLTPNPDYFILTTLRENPPQRLPMA